jgi:hypothetical protein
MAALIAKDTSRAKGADVSERLQTEKDKSAALARMYLEVLHLLQT